ncbi:Protein of unknown function [Pyronema omphalodes CBS 100304]|uniref:Uncharacterized protein n=1 Tax=Pyronema omphalodes (strain CBS 100304) TaxID=1076935 RepID=U4LH78_PYROM|nr:Protein of unknown function [Pyronema omphalodes CBS 100304]
MEYMVIDSEGDRPRCLIRLCTQNPLMQQYQDMHLPNVLDKFNIISLHIRENRKAQHISNAKKNSLIPLGKRLSNYSVVGNSDHLHLPKLDDAAGRGLDAFGKVAHVSEHRLYQVEGGSDNVCIGVETFNFCYPDAGPGADIEDLGGVAEGC